MSSSELPVVVQAATTLLQDPRYTTNSGAMQQLADWGSPRSTRCINLTRSSARWTG